MALSNISINSLLGKSKSDGADGKPVSDGTISGLMFIPKKTGKGTWYLRYSFGGKEKRWA